MATSSISGHIQQLRQQQSLLRRKADTLRRRGRREPSSARTYAAFAQKYDNQAESLNAKIQHKVAAQRHFVQIQRKHAQIQGGNAPKIGAQPQKKSRRMAVAKTAVAAAQIQKMRHGRNFDHIPVWMKPSPQRKKAAPRVIPRLKATQRKSAANMNNMQARAAVKPRIPQNSTGLYGAQNQARLQQTPQLKPKKPSMISAGLTMARILTMGM